MKIHLLPGIFLILLCSCESCTDATAGSPHTAKKSENTATSEDEFNLGATKRRMEPNKLNNIFDN